MKLPLAILAIAALGGCTQVEPVQVDQAHLRKAVAFCQGTDNILSLRSSRGVVGGVPVVRCADGAESRLDSPATKHTMKAPT